MGCQTPKSRLIDCEPWLWDLPAGTTLVQTEGLSGWGLNLWKRSWKVERPRHPRAQEGRSAGKTGDRRAQSSGPSVHTASVPKRGDICNPLESLTRTVDLQRRNSWHITFPKTLSILIYSYLLRILRRIWKNHIFICFIHRWVFHFQRQSLELEGNFRVDQLDSFLVFFSEPFSVFKN